jgi:hypothetical protein
MVIVMKVRLVVSLFASSLFLASGCTREREYPLTAVDLNVLLSRMTNVNTFAEVPLGKSFLKSTYDPTGGNQDWATYTQAGSNGRITVFEAEGPGYISRIWIASYYAKRWLFFFDDESAPRLDLARDELFGEKFPFAAPLAGESSGGRYSLLPIPFSKRIRIEIIPSELRADKRNYLQINYTKLPLKHNSVTSFPETLSSVQSNLVNAVNANWKSQDDEMRKLAATMLESTSNSTVASNQSQILWADKGEGILRNLVIRVDEPSVDLMSQELLRKLRLRMFWDGQSFPSVDVPLGDFFCNPLYSRSFAAMPLGVINSRTFVSQFPMPYRKGARVELRNDSEKPVNIAFSVNGDRESMHELSRRFHAKWSASTVSGKPFEMLNVKGSGHYVGCMVTAIGQDGSWNILEGDEYIKPDEGKQPIQFGTGLEDYFSGAYYYTSLFDLPLHGLIEKGAMRTDQYRFHLLESVAFDKSFEMGFEFGHGNASRGYMSGVAYWYGDKPVDQSISSDQERLLRRPTDRFEMHGLMTPFLLLERQELYADAGARMDFFANRYRLQPWSDLLRVRAVGYRERTVGFEAVRGQYERLAKSTFSQAAEAARNRLWLAQSSTNALLGIHALCRYQLKKDGKVVAEGEGRNDLRVLRVPFNEDDHTWEVVLAPTHQGSFFSLCLRTQQGDITSAGDWELLNVVALEGREPPEYFSGRAVLPNMTVWSFPPSAYVNMQSPAMGIQLWSFWDSRPMMRQVSLRKKWSVADVERPPVEEQERSEDALRMHAVD